MGVVLQKQKSIHMNGYSVWVRRVKLQLRSTQYNYANIWNGYDIHVDVEVFNIWVCRGFRVARFYMIRTKLLEELKNNQVLNWPKSFFLVSKHIYLYSRIEYWSLLIDIVDFWSLFTCCSRSLSSCSILHLSTEHYFILESRSLIILYPTTKLY